MACHARFRTHNSQSAGLTPIQFKEGTLTTELLQLLEFEGQIWGNDNSQGEHC